MARRGAQNLDPSTPGSASEAWRDAMNAARTEGERRGPPPAREAEVWIREDVPLRDEARRAVRRGTEPQVEPERPRKKAPDPVAGELTAAVGPKRAPRLEERLMDATRAYERDRYTDARKILRRLTEEAPAAPAVRELHGLTLYRMGRWADAIKELEAFVGLTASYDQHPVLADCYRALRRYRRVEELWEDLRTESPGAELVAEGRIVMAGSLADQGRVEEAVRLLERARTDPKRPKLHHLRLWYALADLYERAGEVPRARDLFGRVAAVDSTYADVAERLAGLG